MKIVKNPYEVFDNYIIRTPIFSNSEYSKFIENSSNFENADFLKISSNKLLMTGIFIASENLFNQIDKWKNGGVIEEKKIKKIKNSLFKYFTRASNKCTPFGIFAGSAIGNFSDKSTEIILSEKRNYFGRLNIEFLHEVLFQYETQKINKSTVLYKNSTLYKLGNIYRYVERSESKNFKFSQIENDEYLNYLLEITSREISLDDILKNFHQKFKDIIDNDDLIDFIESLIDNQILIKDNTFKLTGRPGIEQAIEIAKNNNFKSINDLTLLKKALDNIKHGDFSYAQSLIQNQKNTLKTSNIYSSIIQVETYLETKKNIISDGHISKVKKTISFLNNISYYSPNKDLIDFKNNFKNRFGEEKISISVALDPESGVPFRKVLDFDENPIIDDLVFNERPQNKQTNWNPMQLILKSKIDKVLKEGGNTVILNNNDSTDLLNSWNDLPDTLSSMINIICINGRQKIIFNGFGGSSASNIHTRFCYGNSEIYGYVKKINHYEQSVNPEKILAEIIHLPENRLFNIFNRPGLKPYEIPILSKSHNHSKQINLNDIYIHIDHKDDIILSSNKYNKEIIPYLSNAHNYDSGKNLPIYEFLSEMQFYKKRKSIYFDTRPLEQTFKYIPRIEYNDVILKKATWVISTEEIKDWYILKNNWNKLKENIVEFLKINDMCESICLKMGEDEWPIDFNNYNSVLLLLNLTKNHDVFQLIENLSKYSIVKNQNGETFSNEIILGFYNSNKLKYEKKQTS